ncbi:hypothetical protein [Paraburkholderia phenazinium]|jgi:hypothetical protein|uniref:Uncharacterized protein n=1 Tax=Paraburkholderia phenazinium TaxID=60549 RepID=A0A1N6JME3_9BURK|nr:hypothetical protein [Paraburkholderia phenazinium]SIO45515.1 hypothetical protein SAMN05444168_4669 [Paraburkholderia phenazinium]
MTPATIAMLRAYLLTASLAAAAIQMVALLSIGLFGVPEAVFTSGPFRLVAVASVVCIVLVVKRIARAAFLSALSLDYATVTDAHSNTTSVSPVCPVRMLVILHLRFNRRPIAWATC